MPSQQIVLHPASKPRADGFHVKGEQSCVVAHWPDLASRLASDMGGCRSAGSSGGSASDCGVGYPGGRTPRCSIRAPNASASAVAQSTLADRFATIALRSRGARP